MVSTVCRKPAGTCSGCEDQRLIGDCGVIAEFDDVLLAIDGHCAGIRKDIDRGFLVPTCRPYPCDLFSIAMDQKLLGKRRPFIWQMNFLTDQGDRAGVTSQP